MSTKHTPGPWEWSSVWTSSPTRHFLEIGGERVLEEVGPLEEPDGLLIVAAPDILAALKRLVQPNITARLEDYNAARAAIAKAEGR